MAQPIACDICTAEHAVQMLSNLETGGTMAIGPACTPVFYAQMLTLALDAGEHDKPAGKCQACRRIHERVTTPDKPIEPAVDVAAPDVGVDAGDGATEVIP